MVRHTFPSELSFLDPAFRDRCQSWACEVQCEMAERVLVSKEKIDASLALLAQVDQILARK